LSEVADGTSFPPPLFADTFSNKGEKNVCNVAVVVGGAAGVDEAWAGRGAAGIASGSEKDAASFVVVVSGDSAGAFSGSSDVPVGVAGAIAAVAAIAVEGTVAPSAAAWTSIADRRDPRTKVLAGGAGGGVAAGMGSADVAAAGGFVVGNAVGAGASEAGEAAAGIAGGVERATVGACCWRTSAKLAEFPSSGAGAGLAPFAEFIVGGRKLSAEAPAEALMSMARGG
jgi:hypothetical protein